MIVEPGVRTRAEQPYVAIRGSVTMQSIVAIADRIPEVFGWLAERGIEPAGAPFLKYNVVDMERELEVEAGVPVAADPGTAGGEVFSGVLPAGRYATLTYFGHYAGLADATGELHAWAEREGLRWDASEDLRTWACRLEIYLTDPAAEPDPAKWETELAFRLAD